MKCPVCKKDSLIRTDLEKDLSANACNKCGGHWIPSDKYLHWIEKHGSMLPEQPPFDEISFQVEDKMQAKLCPNCGRILIKYRVGHGLDFFLDHCNSCNGVWLDKHEWNVLKSRNLHHEIHRIFTTSWQKQIREEEVLKSLEKLYTEKFGKEDYDEIKRIRQWIRQHSQRSALLAYLNDDDPYKV